MDDHRFLCAMLDAPEDDAPRLVYADWLEENGQPERAEFIRNECAMAAIHDEPGFGPNEWDSPRFWELEKRCRELYDRHAAAWFAPLFRVFRGELLTRRGFPWHIALSARQFIDRGRAIFQAAPTIVDVFINLSRLGGSRHKSLPLASGTDTLQGPPALDVRGLYLTRDDDSARIDQGVLESVNRSANGNRVFPVGQDAHGQRWRPG